MLTSREVRGGTTELIIFIKPKDTGDEKRRRRRDAEGISVLSVYAFLWGCAKGKAQVRRSETEDQGAIFFSQASGREASSGQ